MTSVVPQPTQNQWGFSPCGQMPWHLFLGEHIGRATAIPAPILSLAQIAALMHARGKRTRLFPAKHLQAYLDEMRFRFNNRKNPYHFRDTIMRLIQTPNLEYKELTKSAA
jgi:hypothetical protein